MNYPKISIVTPSFNRKKHFEATILSVLNQKYPNLEYIIIDGGSTDGSVDVIRKYEAHLAHWVSEPDDGMYHALQKGFNMSSGEIMGWLNSDDRLHANSLFILAEVFSRFGDVNWVQGVPTVIDESNRTVFVGSHTDINRSFFYQRKHEKSKRYIQQESTFWRRTLWERAGSRMATEYKYAGDFELWMRFFQYDKLWNLNALIGSFRLSSEGQISTDLYDAYIREARKVLDSLPLSSAERRKIRWSAALDNIVHKFERRVNALKLRLGLSDKTTLNNKIYFEPVSQSFKKHPN